MKTIAYIILAPIVLIPIIGLIFMLAVFHAFVIATLWKWFMVPIFALPLLTKAQAYGLGLFISYFTSNYKPEFDEKDSKKVRAITNLLNVALKPVMTLLLGYIIITFFM